MSREYFHDTNKYLLFQSKYQRPNSDWAQPRMGICNYVNHKGMTTSKNLHMHQRSNSKTMSARVESWTLSFFALSVTEKTLLFLEPQEMGYWKIMLKYSDNFHVAASMKRGSTPFRMWTLAILQWINSVISKIKTRGTIQDQERL